MKTYDVLGVSKERAQELFAAFVSRIKYSDPDGDNFKLIVELANTKEEAVYIAHGYGRMP